MIDLDRMKELLAKATPEYLAALKFGATKDAERDTLSKCKPTTLLTLIEAVNALPSLISALEAEREKVAARERLLDEHAGARTALANGLLAENARAIVAEAKVAKLREAVAFYKDPGDYTAPQTGYVYGGANKLWADCGQVARPRIQGDRR